MGRGRASAAQTKLKNDIFADSAFGLRAWEMGKNSLRYSLASQEALRVEDKFNQPQSIRTAEAL